ncbi:ImmA/IrrE family metallo-endopeptidase [Rhodococcus jostii]|uniref:ImmA/IrrE family metallo-endopeptidase n=1 Tax=Rhodococcus jostii TaxID=132919 RepID=UPI003634636A
MLNRLARQLGVRILEEAPPIGRGFYVRDSGVILLSPDLSGRERDDTLSHELGHALYGDDPGCGEHFHARQERAADQFAARLLIDPCEVEALETAYGPNWPKIAYEMGVTDRLLAVWRDMHSRTRMR